MRLGEGIWIAPLCGRVEGSRRLIASVAASDPEARVVAVLGVEDPDHGELFELARLAGWKLIILKGAPTVVEKVNEALAFCPFERFYGFLQNDMVLETTGVLAALAAACPDFGLSYCDDDIHGRLLATSPCVGGKLARAQGFVFYPEAKHNGVDVYLMQIAHLFGGCVYLAEHRARHNHHSHGRSPIDTTYLRAQSFQAADREAERLWRTCDLKRTIQNVQRAYE